MELEPPRIVMPTHQKFPLGRTVITSAAQATLPPHEPLIALARHAKGDWGELDDEDRATNERALVSGQRIFSVYTTRSGIRFWIITEWGRSVTTILLPDDY